MAKAGTTIYHQFSKNSRDINCDEDFFVDFTPQQYLAAMRKLDRALPTVDYWVLSTHQRPPVGWPFLRKRFLSGGKVLSDLGEHSESHQIVGFDPYSWQPVPASYLASARRVLKAAVWFNGERSVPGWP